MEQTHNYWSIVIRCKSQYKKQQIVTSWLRTPIIYCHLSFRKIFVETFNQSREILPHFSQVLCKLWPKNLTSTFLFSFVPLNSIECLTRPINIDEFELSTRFSLFFSVKSWSFPGVFNPLKCVLSRQQKIFPLGNDFVHVFSSYYLALLELLISRKSSIHDFQSIEKELQELQVKVERVCFCEFFNWNFKCGIKLS